MPHISFSALKIWKECAHKYKLNYIDDVKLFNGNEFTAFGTALHEACERKVLDNTVDEVQIFKEKFDEEIKKLEKVLDEKNISEMQQQGILLSSKVLEALTQYFGSFTVVSAEEELKSPVEGTNFDFKGYVDLILQTSDGKYHIIDWKTCSWGWDAMKRNDPITNYQLTLYKHFFGKIKNIDPKLIETHFALLKRTAKKDIVELFRITSGPKKVENSLKILNNAVHNIATGKFPKNKLNCKNCEFYKTPQCP
jgi:hypothetical protein